MTKIENNWKIIKVNISEYIIYITIVSIFKEYN